MHPYLAHGLQYYGISSSPQWWVIGAIFALVFGLLLARRSGKTA